MAGPAAKRWTISEAARPSILNAVAAGRYN